MTRKTVLVVDDNPVNRKLASAFLRRLGYDALEAVSGEEALQQLNGNPYESILLDISMPGLSGLDVLERIRSDPEHAGQHVIAYTAHAQQEDIERLRQAGFNDVLIKPINLDHLVQVLPGLEQG